MSNLIERRNRIRQAVPHLSTASGSIASFQTDLRAQLEEIKIHFNPQQAAGTPSPVNQIPIYGWTGLDVFENGKNFFNEQAAGYTQARYVNYSTGGLDSWGSKWYASGFVPIKSGVNYVLSCNCVGVANAGIAFYDSNQGYISGIQTNNSSGVFPFTTPSNARYMRFSCVEPENLNPHIELGSTASTYATYVGNQIPVSWSSLGTVYGGWENPISGEVWATHGFYHVTGTEPDSRWFLGTSTIPDAPYRPALLNVTEGYGGAIYHGVISDKIGGDNNWQPGLYKGNINPSGHFQFGAPAELSTKALAKEWVQSIGGIDICFLLAHPQLVGTISPIQLKTLIGTNNIWSNANGDVDVRYWKH